MYEVIATESHIWIVTELCCGGELFDYLVEKGRLSEDETRVIFGQLCLAVDYLHNNNIVHRDLKLENVLLDERCRVKLGDFGFTREFERGTLMETFCGTTGYASPEMLQAKKYQGPEVDVWSLGIIMYCLLTGTLPFDDDDEDVMRSKIIKGEFEDPIWLSIESRDLIKNILVKDVDKRYTIPQILAHPWFTSRKLTYESDSPVSAMPLFLSERPATPEDDSMPAPDSSQASTQDSVSPFIKNPDLVSSTPTTPEESLHDPFESTENSLTANELSIPRLPSNSTIRKTSASDLDSVSSKLAKRPATVVEEEREDVLRRHTPSPLIWSSKVPPPTYPVRTPARTKRRSVSSILSESASPTVDKTPTPLPAPTARDLDFQGMLSARAPVMFSTPPERHLLSTLALLGFDTAQIVHSVLSNACDASGALWWMISKKEEKAILEHSHESSQAPLVSSPTDMDESAPERGPSLGELTPGPTRQKTPKKKRNKVSAGTQTDIGSEPDDQEVELSMQRAAAPRFALVPPTPTFASGRPSTPPRAGSPTPRNPLLSPSSSTITGDVSSARSHPSTPSGSLKDMGSKGRKARSGSVSIMQRATTALEAAGLVRKKSSEAVREEKERDKERERERSRDAERGRERVSGGSGDEPRSSHGSGGSSKLTKSPPLKPVKDHGPVPTTPPPNEASHGTTAQMGSPWVLAEGREAMSQPGIPATPQAPARGEMLHSHSTPNFTSDTAPAKPAATTGSGRARANFLTAFRLWFNEERKGKRKEAAENVGTPGVGMHQRPPPSAGRRGSVSAGKFNSRAASRTQRPSMSSRRSSSVNSRRSSGTSVQMMVLDSPQIPTRRSFGSHTPNSERGEHSSRPSSIRSISMQPRHRKSPSQSSSGSVHLRTASPMQKFHRRAGSASSSTTRVVRQIAPVGRAPQAHARSNSAASSIHSAPSSRPTSWYEPSEGEGVPMRTASPYKSRSRRSVDEGGSRRAGSGGAGTATFVAQKRSGPFQSPAAAYGSAGSVGRSSWKKSWGMEPPGWSSRTAHVPVEVLAISPATEPTSIRDVFSGKAAAGGDESDWVDEDDDIPLFVGGLGQVGMPLSNAASNGYSHSHSHSHYQQPEPKPITLSPAPRGHRTTSSSKRAGRNGGGGGGNGSSGSGSNGSRQKAGAHSPAERASPLPPDTGYDSSESRPGRRSLPAARSGPAFKHAIQEEDEGEEE
ncbi:Pkinase-domain-containing protein [Pholiota conissans]|uniref:Pkinase-domain-containing protein n=1 Tax=Pholiota conissans TaxID=109636 RepID=A0A9P5Z5H4_9AGAR|nr:Pkinase-domain-containing protein [Pholiota conissans]